MVLGPWSFGFLGLSRFPGFGVSGPLDLWVSGSLFLGFWVSGSLILWVCRSLSIWVSGSLGSRVFAILTVNNLRLKIVKTATMKLFLFFVMSSKYGKTYWKESK